LFGALVRWFGAEGSGASVVPEVKMAAHRPLSGPLPDMAKYRYLRANSRAGLFWLPIRLFIGFAWLEAGWHKATGTGWLDGGSALAGFWKAAAAVPEQGRPAITYDWYRDFTNTLLTGHHETWFAPLIVAGEIAVGLGLLFGVLTGLAAFFGAFMNMTFLLAGSGIHEPDHVCFRGRRDTGLEGCRLLRCRPVAAAATRDSLGTGSDPPAGEACGAGACRVGLIANRRPSENSRREGRPAVPSPRQEFANQCVSPVSGQPSGPASPRQGCDWRGHRRGRHADDRGCALSTSPRDIRGPGLIAASTWRRHRPSTGVAPSDQRPSTWSLTYVPDSAHLALRYRASTETTGSAASGADLDNGGQEQGPDRWDVRDTTKGSRAQEGAGQIGALRRGRTQHGATGCGAARRERSARR
jgi:uncharacterized membrane protein YphA (DoxX/SURF4 family)